jgi:hypothetical protein
MSFAICTADKNRRHDMNQKIADLIKRSGFAVVFDDTITMGASTCCASYIGWDDESCSETYEYVITVGTSDATDEDILIGSIAHEIGHAISTVGEAEEAENQGIIPGLAYSACPSFVRWMESRAWDAGFALLEECGIEVTSAMLHDAMTSVEMHCNPERFAPREMWVEFNVPTNG